MLSDWSGKTEHILMLTIRPKNAGVVPGNYCCNTLSRCAKSDNILYSADIYNKHMEENVLEG